MSTNDPIVGHKSFQCGPLSFRHEPLRKSEADELLRHVEAERQRRAELMPDERAAINAMFDAWYRLTELGWRNAICCPKDGSEFLVIESGSTGIHRCVYHGEWPTGGWWIVEDGDMSPSRPVLFRPLDDAAIAAAKEAKE